MLAGGETFHTQHIFGPEVRNGFPQWGSDVVCRKTPAEGGPGGVRSHAHPPLAESMEKGQLLLSLVANAAFNDGGTKCQNSFNGIVSPCFQSKAKSSSIAITSIPST
jgi:hypothetical protein